MDEAIRATEAVIEQTRRVKEGLLQELLTKGIHHTRFKKTSIGEIPEGWEVFQVEQISEVTSSKRVFAADYADTGVPFFRSKEVIRKAKGLEIDETYFISQECFDGLTARHGAPSSGDILVSAVGSIGYIYQVKEGERFYFKDGNLLWLRSYKRPVVPSFLKYFCRSRTFQSQLERVTGGSSQSALTIEKLKKLWLPLPAVHEQERLAEQLDSTEDLLENQRAKRASLAKIKAGLLQDLLTGKVRVTV